MVLSLFCCFKKRTNQLKKSSSLSSKNSNNRDEPPNKVSLIRRQEKVMSSLIVNTKESQFDYWSKNVCSQEVGITKRRSLFNKEVGITDLKKRIRTLNYILS